MKRGHSSPDSYLDNRLTLLSNSIRFGNLSATDFDHPAWLDSIWRQAPVEQFVAVNTFLDYHARVSHPLANPAVVDGSQPTAVFHGSGNRRVLREQDVEQITRELLEKFFWNRLVPLGCVETGLGANGHEVCFRLASAGCYLFGLTAELSYGVAEIAGSVVVQPNFEIVFLHPNLAAELDFAPFAERCGKQVGVLFRLTRRQSLRAAELGIDVTSVLASLARHSSKPVPANVAEELRAWFGSCRTLTQRTIVVIEAPDPATAVRVQRLLGDRATWSGGTRVEWQGDSIPADLRRKLSGNGLFF
jgi:hypothetical protein